MGMLQAAVAAHLHGAPMAHSIAARPFLSEIDIVDKDTQLYEYDVIKLPVSGHMVAQQQVAADRLQQSADVSFEAIWMRMELQQRP